MDEAADIWVSLAQKVAKAGLGGLMPEELVVYRVFVFVSELEMGGTSGALYNLSPASGRDQHQWLNLRRTAELLAAIGDRESAGLLLEAADALEKIREPLPSTWEEAMEAAKPHARADLWEAIELRVPEIYDTLEAYTRAHFP